jgi:hypothetical protein
MPLRVAINRDGKTRKWDMARDMTRNVINHCVGTACVSWSYNRYHYCDYCNYDHYVAYFLWMHYRRPLNINNQLVTRVTLLSSHFARTLYTPSAQLIKVICY